MLCIYIYRKSDAFNLMDKAQIHAVVEQFVGHDNLNKLVLSKIRDWTVSTMEIKLENEIRSLGENDRSTLLTMNGLAGLYFEQGLYEKAEQLFSRCLNLRKQNLGDNDECRLYYYYN